MEVLDRFFGIVRPVGDVREHPVDERSLVGIESFWAKLLEKSRRLLWIPRVDFLGGGGEIPRDALRDRIAPRLLLPVLAQRVQIDRRARCFSIRGDRPKR